MCPARDTLAKVMESDFRCQPDHSPVGSVSEVKLWMIDNQMGRRNLADIDRIALQSHKEELLRPLAKANQKARKGNQRGTSSANLRNLSTVNTSKECAKSAGVGERTYDAGKMILEAEKSGEVSKKVVDKIRRKETSIYRVVKDLKESRQKKKRAAQRKKAVKAMPKTALDNIQVGDFRKLSDVVSDGSLSLIFTDPPYDKKSVELYDGLGKFAADKLCEGGSQLCYVGQTQLPLAMDHLWEHLRYWWTVCCLHSGGANLMNEYGIRCGWKAVLWFVKDTRGDKETIVSDVMSGGREKDHHDWQQAESEAAYWIKQLCPPDGIVCDSSSDPLHYHKAALEIRQR